jgi:hypothetical protein
VHGFQRTGRRERLFVGAGRTAPGTPLPVPDRGVALSLLRELGQGPWGRAELRRIYAEAVGRAAVCWESDDAVLEGLARRLVTGELVARSVVLEEVAVVRGPIEPSERAPIAPRLAPAAPDEPAEEADELLEGVEAEALARGAEEGLPFCEECAKHADEPPPVDEALAEVDQDTQAATLQRAAETAAPFCEECERRKRHAA